MSEIENNWFHCVLKTFYLKLFVEKYYFISTGYCATPLWLTRWDLPSLTCEIPPWFLSNLDKSLFLKTHIWADAAGFARNTFGVVGKGPREAGMCGNPFWGWNLLGRGFLGTGDALSPRVGFFTALVTGAALLVRNTRGKRRSSSSSHGFSRQQLENWIQWAFLTKITSRMLYRKDFFLLPSSPIVKNLSFFLLGCDLTCPPRRWTCSLN